MTTVTLENVRSFGHDLRLTWACAGLLVEMQRHIDEIKCLVHVPWLQCAVRQTAGRYMEHVRR